MAAAYDPENVFAKILRGEIPSHKVYEDEVALAFMDIMPRADGHVLVIPKAPARNLLDIAPDALCALIARVQHVAKAASEAFAADGLTLQQFNESAGGQVVFHLHFHILPRIEGVALRPPGTMADSEKLKAHAEKIKAALGPFPG
ncbi:MULTISPECIES: HIT family protein [Methylosinus]|uniref:HIT domain-containing protein n=1 Tax=Methylosinus trichosporium (strain ATCC 35070 / NCIMB 11131 / UNIQEM 75 / OB3b) TaxID=595536 RepID=A0A2D2CW66_METT3|nr:MULTISPECIES: HIT domain-containing protein [Methylosinus]ATQ66914.1 HIT domain-containing protein [Methylosinus trichosporium OB3b]OBS54124.1 HIT family hydrolase [Methylosinus sp. 3S-1]